MKLNKILIVCLILLAIMTIGAVSATDASDTPTLDDVGSGQLAVANSPGGDAVLSDDGDDGEPDVDSEDNPISIFSEAYVGEHMADIMLKNGSEGSINVKVDGKDALDKNLTDDDWEIEPDYDDDSYVHYKLTSSMLTPQLDVGDYEVTVTYVDEDGNKISNSANVALFKRNIEHYAGYGIFIEIEALTVNIDNNEILASIKARSDATKLINVSLTIDDDNFYEEFVCQLDEWDPENVYEIDEDYSWFVIKTSNFNDIEPGLYNLTFTYWNGTDDSVEKTAEVRLTNDQEDDEEFDFDPVIYPVMRADFDNDWDEIMKIYSPGEGNFTVTVSNNGQSREFVRELDGEDGRVRWYLKDLDITEMGVYQIDVKYISPEGDETDVCSGQLIVSDADVAIEFDINDENYRLVSVYCPEGCEGFIVVAVDAPEGNWEYKTFVKKYHEITPADYNNYVNWTISDFGISNETGEYYWLHVFFIRDEDEELDFEDGFNRLDDFALEGIDYTQFRADFGREIYLLLNWSIVSVYCPEGSEGSVNVTIMNEDGAVVFTSVKNIKDKDDENWLNWILTETDLDVGFYDVKAVVNDNETFTGPLEIVNPINIEKNTYIDADDEYRMNFIDVRIPTYIEDASIVIKLNGSEIFNHKLADFIKSNDTTTIEDLTWDYARMYGPAPMPDLKEYDINTKNIGCELTPGLYNVSVSVVMAEKTISNEANVTIGKAKEASENGVTIKIYDAGSYYIWDDEMYFAELEYEDIEGTAVVTIAGDDDWNKTFDLADDDWDKKIYPYDLRLDAGTYEITVTVYDDEDRELVRNAANITLEYGEDGIMSSSVNYVITYSDDWGINIRFDTNNFSGYLVIKFDGTEYYNEHINSSSITEYDDEGRARIGFSAKQLEIPMGHYDWVEIFYYGDNGMNSSDSHDDVTVVADRPEIYIRFSDWESRLSQYSLDRDDLIGVHVNSDNISAVRIVVEIDGETCLDAMLEDLGLTPNFDDDFDEYGYYNIGFDLFNKTLELGQHYKVVAYYYSDEYQLDTIEAGEEGWNPNFFDVIGIVDEIDINDDSDVLFVIGDETKDKITLEIWDENMGEWLEPIEYYIEDGDHNKLITWKLADLGIGKGNYHIEAKYDDDDEFWIFGSDFYVVDKSKFYLMMGCDWYFTTDDVIRVWCPEEGNITIILTRWGEEFNIIEHEITDEEIGTYVGFTLSDLNITEPEMYGVYITVDGKPIHQGEVYLEVPNPVGVENTNVFLPEEGFNNDNSMKLAEVIIPSDLTGNITVTVDGTVLFNENIESIEHDVDGPKMIYPIYTSDLGDSVEVGIHNVEVTFNEFANFQTVYFCERNSKTEDGITIIILNGSYNINWGDTIAEIIAPENANGKVIVELNGSEAGSWDELRQLECNRYDDDNMIYYINTYDLNIHMDLDSVGVYNMVITYDDSVSNEDTITFMGEIAYGIWMNDNSDNGYVGPNDHWFVIHNLDGHTGRVVLTVNGEVRLNKTVDELDVNDWGEPIITPANANLGVGHYEDVLLVFTSDEDYSYQALKVNGGTTVIWGNVDVNIGNEEIKMWDTIANIFAPCMADGTIVFTIDGTEYFTCALTDINRTNVVTEDPYYMIYGLVISDFTDTVKAGNYTDVMIYYYGGDGFNTTNMESWNPRCEVAIWDNSKINMEDFEYAYPSGNVTVDVTGGIVAKQNVTVDEHPEAIIDVVDGVITIQGLDKGPYTLRIVTTPDEFYYSTEGTVGFTVTDSESDVKFSNDVVFDYGKSGTTTITVTGGTVALGNISVDNHTEAIIAFENNVITVSNLTVGNYTLRVITTPDEDFKSVERTAKVTVNKIDSPIVIDIPKDQYTALDDFAITISNVTAVDVTINGKPYAVKADGTVDIDTTSLDADTYEVIVSNPETPIYKANSTSKQFAIVKKQGEVSISVGPAYNVGDDFTIGVTNNTAVNVTINDNPYEVKDGKVVVDTTKLAFGEYTVVASIEEDGKFKANSTTAKFTIEKIHGEVKVTVDATHLVGDDFTIGVTNNTAVNVTINDSPYEVKDGKVVVDTTKLAVGEYTVVASIAGDDKFLPSNDTVKFTVIENVTKKDSPIVIDIPKDQYTALDDFAITISNVTAVDVTINGKPYAVKADGTVDIDTTSLDADTYEVIVSNPETAIYKANSTSKQFTIVKKQGEVSISVGPVYNVGDEFTIGVTNNTAVNVTINNNPYEVKDGKVAVDTTKLAFGEYTVVASIEEDGKFKANSTTAKFTIEKIPGEVKVTVDPTHIVGDDFTIAVSNNTAVSVTINDSPYNVKADGTVDVDTTKLDVGEYTVVATIAGDDKFLPSNDTAKFTIVGGKLGTELRIVSVSGAGVVEAVLTDADGAPIANAVVNYTVSGVKNSTTTNSKGEIVINATGNCVVEIEYAGDHLAMPCNVSITLKGLAPARINTTIEASDYQTYAIDFKSGERGNYFRVQLKDITGKVLANQAVKIGFNGVVYDKITDSNGWAQLQINLANAGIYTFAVAFLSTDEYHGSFVVQKITVNAKPTSISAAAKTYKASAKTKSYTVTLKTTKGSSLDGKTYMGAGKKVTITVNGKTYSANTNSKGQATFKLSITKKGTYTATINFAGDKTYAASKATAKIKIN